MEPKMPTRNYFQMRYETYENIFSKHKLLVSKASDNILDYRQGKIY